MQHLYWGESIYHNIGEVRNRNSEIQEYYESYHRQNKRWIKQSEWKKSVFRVNNVGYREPIIDWFIHKLRQDFKN